VTAHKVCGHAVDGEFHAVAVAIVDKNRVDCRTYNSSESVSHIIQYGNNSKGAANLFNHRHNQYCAPWAVIS